jgi:hypothetical protein
VRTISSTVVFKRPFSLPGFDRPHAPGTFEVKTDEESLDASFGAWRRVATNVMLVDRGQTQAWRVEPRELADAIEKDVAESLNDE